MYVVESLLPPKFELEHGDKEIRWWLCEVLWSRAVASLNSSLLSWTGQRTTQKSSLCVFLINKFVVVLVGYVMRGYKIYN